MSVEIGQVLDGKYKISRLIGQGGMGAVYEGVHQLIDRRVAIKVLLPHQDESSSERFQQEARAAGRIGNDHILEVLDLGSLPDGSKYMVCEFLDGTPLSDRIGVHGTMGPEEIVPLAVQLLSGLQAAHGAGVLHRDLKPDNIFVLKQKAGKKDFVKIIDFGISKFAHSDGGDGLSMTKTGMMVGTPNYMSPEQARGLGGIDARADIYAVGVILYEAVSGQLPYSAETFNDLIFKIVLEEPTPLEDLMPSLPADFVAIVKKGMARDRDNRFSTAEEFALALQNWAERNGVDLGASTSRNPSAPVRASQIPTPGSLTPGSLTPGSLTPGRLTPGHVPMSVNVQHSSAGGGSMSTMVGETFDPGLIQATLSSRNPSARNSPVTPSAFGATAPHHIPVNLPWWTRRPAQLGILAVLVCALLLTLGIVLSSDDASEESPTTAASATAESTELPPGESAKETTTAQTAQGDKKLDGAPNEQPDRTDQGAKPAEVAKNTTPSTPPTSTNRASVPPATQTQPATRVQPATQAQPAAQAQPATRVQPAPRVLPEPQPAPPAPASQPRRRVDFGY